MIQSRFNAWFSVILSICFLLMLGGLIYQIATFGKDVPLSRVGGRPVSTAGRVVSIFWCAIFTVISFAILRKKALRVTLNDGEITIRNFLGFGLSRSYVLSDFLGFTTSVMHSRAGRFETLSPMLPDGRAIELSGFYYTNYPELKEYIVQRLQNLGYKPYSSFHQFKALFT